MSFNNETYFEFNGFDDKYTVVPNYILNETNISAKAIGIYVKILKYQNSKEHKVYISSLINTVKDGKDSISSAIKELINLGYVQRMTKRNEKGQLAGYKYIVYAKPIQCVGNTETEPKAEKPSSVNPISDNPLHKKKIGKKENKIKTIPLSQIDEVWKLYPNKKGKSDSYKNIPKLISQHGFEEIKKCVERYCIEVKDQDKKYMMYGSTFFNGRFEDYLDENYEPSNNQGSKDKKPKFDKNGFEIDY